MTLPSILSVLLPYCPSPNNNKNEREREKTMTIWIYNVKVSSEQNAFLGFHFNAFTMCEIASFSLITFEMARITDQPISQPVLYSRC